MCPNITTEEAVGALTLAYETDLLQFGENFPIKQLIKALRMLMQHNVFRFGSTCCVQEDGTAIGQPPATDWAQQFVAFFEMTVLTMIFGKHLRLDKIFVDDKAGL